MLFLLGKGHPMRKLLIWSISRASRQQPEGMEAIAFVASVKYQACRVAIWQYAMNILQSWSDFVNRISTITLWLNISYCVLLRRQAELTTMSGPTTTSKARSHTPTTNQDLAGLFECPVCFDYVLPPILQCQSGHLVCSTCRPKLNGCPTCRGPLGK